MNTETAISKIAKAVVDDAYRRGFEAAKAAALAAIDTLVDTVPLGQSLAAVSQAHAAVKQLTPEATR